VSAAREIRPTRPATLREANHLARLSYRLSTFALALDAVLPELAFIESAVQTTALGLPLSAGGAHRLNKAAVMLHDLRNVLEWPLPEVDR